MDIPEHTLYGVSDGLLCYGREFGSLISERHRKLGKQEEKQCLCTNFDHSTLYRQYLWKC